jgi:hypothetical protein
LLRRHVPVVVTLVDEPAQLQRSWAIVDSLTTRAGLVTSELVPAYQPSAARRRRS